MTHTNMTCFFCGVSCVAPYFHEETHYKYRSFFEFLLFPLIRVYKYQLTPNNKTSYKTNKHFLAPFTHQHFMIIQLPFHTFLWIFLEKAFKFDGNLDH